MSQQCHTVVINVKVMLGCVNRHPYKKEMKDLFHTIDDDLLGCRCGCLFNLPILLVSFPPTNLSVLGKVIDSHDLWRCFLQRFLSLKAD